MAASGQKPLPAIPRRRLNSQNVATLTIQSQQHLAAFIRSLLSEHEHNVLHGGERENWALALESALVELGASIAYGGWLAGLRRTGMVKRAKEVKREKEAKRDMEAKRDKETKKANEEQIVLEKVGKGHNSQSTDNCSSLDSSSESWASDRRGPFAKSRSPQSRNTDTAFALEQIKHLVAQPVIPSPRPSRKHVLLTVAPGSGVVLPGEDCGFDIIPANVSCSFKSGVFCLPDHHQSHNVTDSIVLYGLDEWDVDAHLSEDDNLQVVGGNFTFRGIHSPIQHSILCRILRISVYIYLSLLLEQHFLANSGVKLEYPKSTAMPAHATLPPPVLSEARKHDTSKHPSRHAFLKTAIFSYFSKKTAHVLHRTLTTEHASGRRRSLDLLSSPSDPALRPTDESATGRPRRLSFKGNRSPSTSQKRPAESKAFFASILEQLEKWKGLLSTSVGVAFPPPPLIISLSEKEMRQGPRKLMGDEIASLSTILGWENESQGVGMGGAAGFVRQQQLSVLYSQHVPLLAPSSSQTLPPGRPPPKSSAGPSHKSSSDSPSSQVATCGHPRWVTFRYYSRHRGADKMLGEVISDLCEGAEYPCDTPGCHYKRGQHQLRLIHNGLKITMDVQPHINSEGGQGEKFELWQSCQVCNGKTARKEMTDGTYLLSFSKFLELLFYSPAVCTLTPSICDHTSPPEQPVPSPASACPLPDSRLNIIRHFSSQSHVVSLSLSIIHDIFEIRIPRLQVMSEGETQGGGTVSGGSKGAAISIQDGDIFPESSADDKRALRREIKLFWEGVSDHLDKLEEAFTDVTATTTYRKTLPRLPSTDGSYEFATEMAGPRSVDADWPPDLLLSAPQSPFQEGLPHQIDSPPDRTSISTSPSSASTQKGPKMSSEATSDPAALLIGMRLTFQRLEQDLYAQLVQTPHSTLNDVRRAFYLSAKGARKRLVAWQCKHLPPVVNVSLSALPLSVNEPEWWSKGCHAVPRGNVIVREDDWGSIIAFTIGSPDYQRELANVATLRSNPSVTPVTYPSSTLGNVSSFLSNRLFSPSSLALPDPDPDQEAYWAVSEECSVVITRKEHPRDPTSLLSLRDVLRQQRPRDNQGAASIGSNPSTTTPVYIPPVDHKGQPAWVDRFSGLDGAAVKVAHDMVTRTSESGILGPSLASDAAEITGRDQALSIASSDNSSTASPNAELPPTPPPKNDLPQTDTHQLADSGTATPTPYRFTDTLASSLSNAMRYVLNTGERLQPRTPFKDHLTRLSGDSAAEDRPHIKYEWTIGKRVKFSCTVYYAKQFDELRRRCGIDDVYSKSLHRSANWAAEGGKSKSNFWKTSDSRFIIKSLVDAWNVDDLQVLIELGPSYFRYMESTSGRPTALAKVMGFYTIEIKNLESGTTQAKADLLVMENLFYDRKISRTFDLKGIQSRKAKASANAGSESSHSRTMYDGDWIQDQQRSQMLLRPHSKFVLQEAIKHDSEFLMKSNIMDYSLLLGVDEERREIACGLVDTIGSYTFAKTLEHKAKQGLNSAGKQITVVPPAKYRDRFATALEGYFVACPDKWSKPMDDFKTISDPDLLPSVL